MAWPNFSLGALKINCNLLWTKWPLRKFTTTTIVTMHYLFLLLDLRRKPFTISLYIYIYIYIQLCSTLWFYNIIFYWQGYLWTQLSGWTQASCVCSAAELKPVWIDSTLSPSKPQDLGENTSVRKLRKPNYVSLASCWTFCYRDSSNEVNRWDKNESRGLKFSTWRLIPGNVSSPCHTAD